MRIIIHITIGLISFLTFSQTEKKYILLDNLYNNYNVKKYTLNTQPLYKINAEIELYNVLDRGIMLFSVLPNPNSKQNWEEINFNEVKNQILTQKEINQWFRNLFIAPQQEKILPKTKDIHQYKLIKKENNKYYASHYCLFEYFKEVSYPEPLRVSGQDILNLEQSPLKIKQMKNFLNNLYKKQKIKMEQEAIFPDNQNLTTNYLSEIKDFDSEHKLYQFWTFTDWNVRDDFNEQRGIERFAYIPKKGIVGGSYDFFFHYLFSLTPKEWQENSENEKILWAKELFPEKQ